MKENKDNRYLENYLIGNDDDTIYQSYISLLSKKWHYTYLYLIWTICYLVISNIFVRYKLFQFTYLILNICITLRLQLN